MKNEIIINPLKARRKGYFTTPPTILDKHFLFKKLLKEIGENTQTNNHTEAKIIVAKFFNLTNYIKIFESINVLHNIDRHLYPQLSEYREIKGREMLQYIKQTEGDEIYNDICNKF